MFYYIFVILIFCIARRYQGVGDIELFVRIFIVCRSSHSSSLLPGISSMTSSSFKDLDASFSSQMSGLSNYSFLSGKESLRSTPQILCFEEFPIYTGSYEHYRQSSRYDPTKYIYYNLLFFIILYYFILFYFILEKHFLQMIHYV